MLCKKSALQGLPDRIILTTLDPIAGALNGDRPSSAAYVTGAKVIDAVEMIASAMAGAAGIAFTQAYADVFAALAGNIDALSAGQTINLSDHATVTALINGVAQAEHVTLRSGVADTLATVIAASNAVLDQKLAADNAGAILLSDVAGVELVAQGTELAAIQSAIANPNQLNTLVDIFTGSNLNNLVSGLPVASPDSGGIQKGKYSND